MVAQVLKGQAVVKGLQGLGEGGKVQGGGVQGVREHGHQAGADVALDLHVNHQLCQALTDV